MTFDGVPWPMELTTGEAEKVKPFTNGFQWLWAQKNKDLYRDSPILKSYLHDSLEPNTFYSLDSVLSLVAKNCPRPIFENQNIDKRISLMPILNHWTGQSFSGTQLINGIHYIQEPVKLGSQRPAYLTKGIKDKQLEMLSLAIDLDHKYSLDDLMRLLNDESLRPLLEDVQGIWQSSGPKLSGNYWLMGLKIYAQIETRPKEVPE